MFLRKSKRLVYLGLIPWADIFLVLYGHMQYSRPMHCNSLEVSFDPYISCYIMNVSYFAKMKHKYYVHELFLTILKGPRRCYQCQIWKKKSRKVDIKCKRSFLWKSSVWWKKSTFWHIINYNNSRLPNVSLFTYLWGIVWKMQMGQFMKIIRVHFEHNLFIITRE